MMSLLWLPLIHIDSKLAYADSTTLYQMKTDAATLPMARELGTKSPSSSASSATTVGRAKGWVEVLSQGGVGTMNDVPPEPSGHGFLYDVTTLEAQKFVAGSWTGYQEIKTNSGSMTADIYIRVFKYSADGTFTPIVETAMLNSYFTSTNTRFISAPTLASEAAFDTGDKLYFDVVLNILENNAGNAGSIRINENSIHSKLVTPPYEALGEPILKRVEIEGLWPMILNTMAGEPLQSRATAIYSNGISRNVTSSTKFASSNPAIATISNAGLVTALSGGETVINATYGGVTGSFQLKVSPPPVKTPRSPATDTELDAIVKSTLDGMNSYGWDPVNKGIFINWRRDNPDMVQCNSTVCDDRSHPTRHDSQNDIRTLQHLYWYKWRHPGDTSMDAAIARILPTVKSKFGTTSSPKGWMYYVLLRIYEYVDNPNDKAYWQNVIVNWADKQYADIDPAAGVQHGRVANCDCGTNTIYLDDAYRVDHQVEMGAALVDAGTRFQRPEWIAAGYKQTMTAYEQAFSNEYNLFTRIYVLRDSVYGSNIKWDTQAKLGEQSEEVDALLRAGAVTTDPKIRSDFFNIAAKMLNGLRDQPIHDKQNGGYYFKMYAGRNFDGKPAGSVETQTKEMRQGSLLGTFHLANMLISPANQWAEQETEMRAMLANTLTDSPSGMFLPDTGEFTGTLNGYSVSNAGYTYNLNADWTVYHMENWVSNESNSLALLGIQQVLTSGLGDGSSDPVLSVTGLSTIVAGAKSQVGVSAEYSSGLSVDVTGAVQYSSSSPAVASVSSSGLITALQAGTTTITARYAGKEAVFILTVNSNNPGHNKDVNPGHNKDANPGHNKDVNPGQNKESEESA